MANTITRRPLPALVSLVALLALTGIVWWRVLNRDTGDSSDATKKPSSAPCSSSAPATTTLPGPSAVTVRVLNSTSKTGIAGKARATLIADGFKVPTEAGNDSVRTPITAPAEIRYSARAKSGAQLLHYYFPGATMKPQTNAFITVTVSLGAGYKAVATPAAVKAALAADRVALSAAPASGSTTGSPSGSATATPAC